ncbi:uncharacterized protein [Lepeophtheirus salmonis]|uniref:Uncharacterized protein n=1 Tax=Lepeophtheirus salmonis TaxID=72036 RepID=A0A0K2UHF4_LEPSM|nr:altered inheritance of mitochondria protein 44-like [Lepeophtheirus salmonis]
MESESSDECKTYQSESIEFLKLRINLIISLQSKDYSEAKSHINQLNKLDPNNTIYQDVSNFVDTRIRQMEEEKDRSSSDEGTELEEEEEDNQEEEDTDEGYDEEEEDLIPV